MSEQIRVSGLGFNGADGARTARTHARRARRYYTMLRIHASM
jgi:hypothetical protein